MTKLCIFCNKRVNSQEHVWPQWLLNIIKQWPGDNMRLQASHLDNAGEIVNWERFDPEIVVGSVCRQCNTGWMSDLEKQSIPIMVPLIDGTPTVLTIEQQMIISAWMIKCAIVFDSMAGGGVFYGEAERFHFRNYLQPFERTTLWLGHYSGPSLSAYSQHGVLHNSGTGTPYNINVLTMAFGRLFMQMADFSTISNRRMQMEARNNEWDQFTVEIFTEPPRLVSWPPIRSFNESQRTVYDLAYRFGRFL